MRIPSGKKRRLFRTALMAVCLVTLVMIGVAEKWMDTDARGRVHTDIRTLPKRKVGLVLGCSRYLANGQRNLYFIYRMQAASQLYHAGKIDFILVSGDNHVTHYDEASDMKAALMQHNIPDTAIICDYAGFSSLDSIVRAKEVFGEPRVMIISQEFHVKRALFIAKRKGLDAIGFCAQDVSSPVNFRTQAREQLARVKTILDLYLLRRQPTYLGTPIQIGPPVQTVSSNLTD